MSFDIHCLFDKKIYFHIFLTEPQFNKDQPVFTHINSSHARLNLQGWASGGCPINAVTLEFRPKGIMQNSEIQNGKQGCKTASSRGNFILVLKLKENVSTNTSEANVNKNWTGLSYAGTWSWQSVRTNATTDVFLAELREATWYELKMKACNSAGCGNQSSQFATLDYDGSKFLLAWVMLTIVTVTKFRSTKCLCI